MAANFQSPSIEADSSSSRILSVITWKPFCHRGHRWIRWLMCQRLYTGETDLTDDTINKGDTGDRSDQGDIYGPQVTFVTPQRWSGWFSDSLNSWSAPINTWLNVWTYGKVVTSSNDITRRSDMMDDSDYHFDFFQDEGKFSGNARWKRRRCALVFFSASRTSEKLLALWLVYIAF